MHVPLALAWVGVASALAFGLAAWDKHAAGRGRPRVRERALLGWAVAGGTPGLLAAMLLLRHKTRKLRFTAWLGGILLLQLAAALALLAWDHGGAGFPASLSQP